EFFGFFGRQRQARGEVVGGRGEDDVAAVAGEDRAFDLARRVFADRFGFGRGPGHPFAPACELDRAGVEPLDVDLGVAGGGVGAEVGGRGDEGEEAAVGRERERRRGTGIGEGAGGCGRGGEDVAGRFGRGAGAGQRDQGEQQGNREGEAREPQAGAGRDLVV